MYCVERKTPFDIAERNPRPWMRPATGSMRNPERSSVLVHVRELRDVHAVQGQDLRALEPLMAGMRSCRGQSLSHVSRQTACSSGV